MLLARVSNFDQARRVNYRYLYRGDNLTLSADSGASNGKTGISRLDGHVLATYRDDTIVADHLEVHLAKDEKYFIASGNILFTDPDGTVKGDELRFSWKEGGQIATGHDVDVTVAGVTVRAGSIDVRPGVWVLNDYFLTNDLARKPLLAVAGSKITIYPGHYAILDDSQLNVLGNKLIGFKERYFNLDPRSSGIRLPTPEYRPGRGLGYNWAFGSLIGKNTDAEFHTDASPGDVPGYGAQVTQSFIPEDKDRTPITPRSPLNQRFAFGYFENILVDKPSDEVSGLSQLKRAANFETNINAGVTGRGAPGELFSIPASVAFESGGLLGHAGYIADLHLSAMDQYRQIYIARAEYQGSLELPPIRIAPHLFNMARIDTAVFQSDTSFAWVRGTESLVFHPSKPFTFGAAGFVGIDAGTPEYDIDPLTYKNGFALRADYKLGPRTASYMIRYDTNLGWFDHEFKFTQTMGSLEAFVIYRKYPGDTHYGVTLRIPGFEDLLTRRNRNASSAVNSDGLP